MGAPVAARSTTRGQPTQRTQRTSNGEWTPRFAAGGGGSAHERRRPGGRTAVKRGATRRHAAVPRDDASEPPFGPRQIATVDETSSPPMEHGRTPFTTADPRDARPPSATAPARAKEFSPNKARPARPSDGGRLAMRGRPYVPRRAVTHAVTRRRADVHAVARSRPSIGTRQGDCGTEMFGARAIVRPRPCVARPPLARSAVTSGSGRPSRRRTRPFRRPGLVVGPPTDASPCPSPYPRRFDVTGTGAHGRVIHPSSSPAPAAPCPDRRAVPPCRTATWRMTATHTGGSSRAPQSSAVPGRPAPGTLNPPLPRTVRHVPAG